ncbi:MAG: ferrous iron transport protein B [Treponema sp.]|jgi:ferrous iron transport protein B|nr:ferrous iron transport protein B [Treponema sp.]
MNITIALAGNPNAGKTTLFNALTGANQFVGNWPGVTVEKKEGRLKGRRDVKIMDLPGVYSLSPYSLEEIITRNYLLEEKPGVIVNVIDGTNLERNLFLSTQLLELGIPVVAAVNMIDEVERSGDELDLAKLEAALGCPVAAISALKGTGIGRIIELAVETAERGKRPAWHITFSKALEDGVADIAGGLTVAEADKRRFYAIKLLERDERIGGNLTFPAAEEIIKRTEAACEDDLESRVSEERYTAIASIIAGCYKKKRRNRESVSDRIDRVVTNRLMALPIFAGVIFLVYFISVTTVGTWVTDWTNDGLFGEGWSFFGLEVPGIPVLLGGLLEAAGTAEWLNGLILDGMVAGVGAVLGFVPQMLVLFFFLAILESCGYMARIAFILDRVFRRFGLSGKSFIPMLVGTGCGIPGVMASRTIENEADRRLTVMTTTFMPCGAKLPVIAMISGAALGGAWWVAPSAYFLGIASVIMSGIILKKTRLFAGDASPFVMELPAYRFPGAVNVLRAMGERGWSFIKKAGSIILVSSALIWFLSSFGFTAEGFGMVEVGASMLVSIGSAIAFIFRPLGFGTWDAAVATITGLVAKENVVGTMGVLYGFAEVAEDGEEMWAAFAANFSALGAYAFLVFNLYCPPCFAAIGAIKREMNNGKWTAFAVGYQLAYGYLLALIIYQTGSLFTGGGFTGGTAAGLAALGVLAWLLFRRNDKKAVFSLPADLRSAA